MTTIDRSSLGSNFHNGPLAAETTGSENPQGKGALTDQNGVSRQVLGEGHVPPGNRAVAWVESGDSPTPGFPDALDRPLSKGISPEIARELGMGYPVAGPMATREVQVPSSAGEVKKSVFAGIDFLTQLYFSATHHGLGYRELNQELTSPELSGEQRAEIDRQMAARFSGAAAAGHGPVSQETARTWLQEELQYLSRRA